MVAQADQLGDHGVDSVPGQVWVPLFFLALFSNLVAVWLPQWLPMQDLGGHIEMMDIVARADDATTINPEFYVVTSPWKANGLSLVLAKAFYPVVPPLVMARLLIGWYVVGLPLAIAFLLSAFGRPRWLAFFSAPMVFNSMFNIGFLNFLVALPFLFFSLGLAKRLVDSGALRWGLALAAVLVLTFYAHIIAFMMAVSMVCTILALNLGRLRDLNWFWTVVPGLVPFGLWVWERMIAREATVSGRTFVASDGGLRAGFFPFRVRFEQLHEWGLRYFKDYSDEVLIGALLVAWLVAWVATRKESLAAETSSKPWRARATLPVLTLGCIVGYFALPNRLHEVEVLAERAWLIALFLFIVWPLPTRPRASRAAFALLAAAALIYPWKVTANHQRFSNELMHDLAEQLEELAPRTGLMYIFDRRVAESDVTHMGPLWHWPRAVHVTANGGFSHDSFMRRPYGSPINYRPGKLPTRHIRRLFKSNALYEYDYLLLLQSREPKNALGSNRVRLRWHGGDWWLFDVIKPGEVEPADARRDVP